MPTGPWTSGCRTDVGQPTLTSLGTDLIAAIPPHGDYAEAAHGWLAGVLAEAFPDLLDGLRTRPASRAEVANLPAGEPGQGTGRDLAGCGQPGAAAGCGVPAPHSSNSAESLSATRREPSITATVAI